MARKDVIEIEGTVLEPLPNATFWVELANGHRVRAHLSEKCTFSVNPILPADKVVLKMSPYDFSKGQIASRRN